MSLLVAVFFSVSLYYYEADCIRIIRYSDTVAEAGAFCIVDVSCVYAAAMQSHSVQCIACVSLRNGEPRQWSCRAAQTNVKLLYWGMTCPLCYSLKGCSLQSEPGSSSSSSCEEEEHVVLLICSFLLVSLCPCVQHKTPLVFHTMHMHRN